VISPQLFSIYVNDLLDQLTAINPQGVAAFADDIVCLGSKQTIKKMLEAVESWSQENDIRLNKDKSVIV
jgi:hypothetical protein